MYGRLTNQGPFKQSRDYCWPMVELDYCNTTPVGSEQIGELQVVLTG